MSMYWVGIGLGMVVGIIGSAFGIQSWLLGGWLAVISILVAWRCRQGKLRNSSAIICLVFGAGMILGIWRFESVVRDPGQAVMAELARQGKILRIRGHLITEPDVKSAKAVVLEIMATNAASDHHPWQEIRETRCRVVLLVGRGTNHPPIQTFIPRLCRPEAYGYQVEFKGLRPQRSDALTALRRKAEPVVLLGHWTGSRIVAMTDGHPIMETALDLKERLLNGFARQMSDRSSRLAAGMTLGDKAAVYGADYHGWPMRDLFARAGIAHLLAVSGSNVGVLAVSVCGLLSAFRLKRTWILAPALAVVVLYTLMTGLPASAQRAAIMTSVGLVVWALPSFKMPGSLYLGLGLAAALILMRDPEELFRPGFQLSFLAVLTLALGTPVVDKAICTLVHAARGAATTTIINHCVVAPPRLPAVASSAKEGGAGSAQSCKLKAILTTIRIFIAAQFAIQLGLNIPASAVYFGHFSLAGLPVNMAAIPLAAILTPGALVVGLLDMIPVAGPWLAMPVAWVVEMLFDSFLWISAVCARWLPYPEVAPWPWWVVVGYYAVLIIGMIVSTKVMNRHKASARRADTTTPVV